MMKQKNITPIALALLSVAIVYGVGATFFTIELERLIERTITPHIKTNQIVGTLNREIYSGVDQFMTSNHVRVIGYTCVGVMILLAIIGMFTERIGLASFSSISFILSIYAYFLLHMSFLAGLGILTALWTPFWGDLVSFGDIAYLPYIVLLFPFSLAGMDIRVFLAGLFKNLGLFIFILGVLTWLYAKYKNQSTAKFWIYRYSRHPQYLGWIIWSYGLMICVAIRHDTALQAINPGASLPWVISTMIIICVALSEEIHMRRQYSYEYERYCCQTPFMIPLPKLISRLISAPFKIFRRKEHPENRWDLVWTFIIYLGVIMLISLPFVLLKYPASGWGYWPF
jgi:protein-S-isoprenylcysteine O-methyltransferase Ste14